MKNKLVKLNELTTAESQLREILKKYNKLARKEGYSEFALIRQNDLDGMEEDLAMLRNGEDDGPWMSSMGYRC